MPRICLRAANGAFGRIGAIWGDLDVRERCETARRGVKMHRKVTLFDDPRELEKQGVKAAEFGEIRRKSKAGKRES
jgi:hypothetical protein